ncbi:hypothetical protein J3Q64DRAFT_1710298 [Phycomyces blakesleeanus]|uniref:Uncharacterized protein n=1 Tax=Phycomyces blakesleeanus TaxID=4837 RepID=A0ABR3BDK9_PHYBL
MVTYEKIKSRVSETHWSKLYIFVAVLQCIIIVGLQSGICSQNTRQADLLPEPTSDNALQSVTSGNILQDAADRLGRIKWENIAFIGFQFWFVVMALDATVYQNTAEILALAIFNVICAILSALQVIDGVRWLDRINAIKPEIAYPLSIAEKIEISLSVTTLVFACIMSFLSYKMSKQFGWNIYKKIGADVKIQKMYRMFQFFVLALKIDIFIEFLVSLFYIIQRSLADSRSDEGSLEGATWFQIVCTILMLPMLYFARTAGSTESKGRMITFIVFQCIVLAHFALVFRKTFQPNNNWYTWIVLVWIGIAMDVATCVLGFICMRNFGEGLKPYVQRGAASKQDIETSNKAQEDNWQIDDD